MRLSGAIGTPKMHIGLHISQSNEKYKHEDSEPASQILKMKVSICALMQMDSILAGWGACICFSCVH